MRPFARIRSSGRWPCARRGRATIVLLLAITGVAFLPGTRFHPDGGGDRQARLSFSYSPKAALTEAVARLAAALAAVRSG